MIVRRQDHRDLADLKPGLLAFRFADIEDELLAFADVADKWLKPRSILQLKNLAGSFSHIASHTQDDKWTTYENEPIETESSGEFEPNGRRTATKLYGRIGFTWQVRPLGLTRSNPRTRWFALQNSSVTIELLRTDTNDPVAHWDFDVGNDTSPGCHFHAKPHWKDFQEAALLPKPVSVPRLPTWLFMPTDCLEFLFGELWQDSWRIRVAESDAKMGRWKSLSHGRHLRMAESHFKRYKDSDQLAGKLSGWMTLKTWKPNAAEFASQ